MKHITSSLFVLVTLFLTRPGYGQEVDREAAWNSLVEVERAFARTSVIEGTRAAFLTFLSEEAVLFRPGPVEGRVWFEERPETSGTLDWAPAVATIARAGDMGYTTGPWSYRDGEQAGFGHYVTVWKKQDDGTWRVAIDAGNSHAEPTQPMDEPSFAEPASVSPKNLSSLLMVDHHFSDQAATEGVLAAYRAYAADDIRVYRHGLFPEVGKAILSERVEDDGVWRWIPSGGDMASSGDFGYTYGLATLTREAKQEGDEQWYSYLRLWRAQPDHTWRIILDLLTAHPVEE